MWRTAHKFGFTFSRHQYWKAQGTAWGYGRTLPKYWAILDWIKFPDFRQATAPYDLRQYLYCHSLHYWRQQRRFPHFHQNRHSHISLRPLHYSNYSSFFGSTQAHNHTWVFFLKRKNKNLRHCRVYSAKSGWLEWIKMQRYERQGILNCDGLLWVAANDWSP